jgi:hypothetical protein
MLDRRVIQIPPISQSTAPSRKCQWKSLLDKTLCCALLCSALLCIAWQNQDFYNRNEDSTPKSTDRRPTNPCIQIPKRVLRYAARNSEARAPPSRGFSSPHSLEAFHQALPDFDLFPPLLCSLSHSICRHDEIDGTAETRPFLADGPVWRDAHFFYHLEVGVIAVREGD